MTNVALCLGRNSIFVYILYTFEIYCRRAIQCVLFLFANPKTTYDAILSVGHFVENKTNLICIEDWTT